MASPALGLSVKLLGVAAIGLALAAGWKLGSHLVAVAMGEQDLCWPTRGDLYPRSSDGEPLWKRTFSKFSE